MKTFGTHKSLIRLRSTGVRVSGDTGPSSYLIKHENKDKNNNFH